ncbi:MAG: M24 family metallopeptidase [Halobacteriales archaeon]
MDYEFIDRELDPDEAFVHIGDRFDDTLRYLTRFGGPDRPYAFVYAAGTAVLCPPSLFGDQARREFPGDRVLPPDVQTAETAAGRAIEAVESLADVECLRVPAHLRHDSAVRLEQAGYSLVSTAAVEEARAVKTADELDALRSVQDIAQRGLARAETILATVETDGIEDGAPLQWDGAILTTERLRRAINAVMAEYGIVDAGNTVIGAGESCADLHFTGEDTIRAGETVLIDISPRGPDGYYGDVTRTFVPGGNEGWPRRAYVAVEYAQDAALEVLADGAGTTASRVHTEAAAELSAHGFEVGDVETGFYHGVGHGVGMSLHEAPSLRAETALTAGNVVTVEPGVYDPSIGGVRIEDLVAVTVDGYENLTDYPRSLVPERRDHSSSFV